MVRTTKQCLRKMTCQAKYTYDELLTAVIEVEAIINSHPLTYVSDNYQEEQLTPSHLLSGHCIITLPENLCYHQPDDEDFVISLTHLNK